MPPELERARHAARPECPWRTTTIRDTGWPTYCFSAARVEAVDPAGVAAHKERDDRSGARDSKVRRFRAKGRRQPMTRSCTRGPSFRRSCIIWCRSPLGTGRGVGEAQPTSAAPAPSTLTESEARCVKSPGRGPRALASPTGRRAARARRSRKARSPTRSSPRGPPGVNRKEARVRGTSPRRRPVPRRCAWRKRLISPRPVTAWPRCRPRRPPIDDSDRVSVRKMHPGRYTPRMNGDAGPAAIASGVRGATASRFRSNVTASLGPHQSDMRARDTIEAPLDSPSRAAFDVRGNPQQAISLNADCSYAVTGSRQRGRPDAVSRQAFSGPHNATPPPGRSVPATGGASSPPPTATRPRTDCTPMTGAVTTSSAMAMWS